MPRPGIRNKLTPIKGVLLVWLLTMPAISPLFQQTIPHTADGLLHLYRVVMLNDALSHGALYPRWLPGLAYGYGLPLFLYYAPLAYYLTMLLHALGLSFVAAFNSSFALAMLMAATGLYMLLRPHFGEQAGLMGSMAYIYAPYPLFTAYFRGSLPISWAWAMAPWVLWAFTRLMQARSPRRDLPLSALLLAAALLMHNISSLLILPLLLATMGLTWLLTERRFTMRWGRVGLAIGLGLGMASFFLIPAVVEKELVQVERAIAPPHFDYHGNFLNISKLLGPPQPRHTGLLNPDTPTMLGWPQLLLAALALGLAARHAKQTPLKGWTPKPQNPMENQIPLLIFAAAGLLLLMGLTLPPAVHVWDAMPLMAFIQQPHRLLSGISLLLAILAGAAVAPLRGRAAMLLTWGGISLIFLAGLPHLYPRYYEALPADLTPAGLTQYEQQSGAIGTTSFGEYLPRTVQQPPPGPPTTELLTPARLDAAYLPPGATVTLVHAGFNQTELLITTPQPFRAVFHSFYFPGWRATLNGQPTTLLPFSEHGLVSLELPAGEQRVRLWFASPPLRQTADRLSMGAGLLVFGLLIYGLTRPARPPSKKVATPQTASALLWGLAGLLIISKLAIFDRVNTPLKQNFTGQHVAMAQVQTEVNFADTLWLLGYDLPAASVSAGEAFRVTGYWRVAHPLTTDFSVLAHLVDARGHLYGGQDNLHPGNLPTSRWSPWGFVRDPHAVRVPFGTPPGEYLLLLGPYNPQSWARLPIYAGGDPAWPDVWPISVRVTRPAQQPTVAQLGIQWPQSQPLSPEVHLLGGTPERTVLRRNDFLRVAIFWEAQQKPTTDYQVAVRLQSVSMAGPRLSQMNRPSHGRYPTLSWLAGERVRDNHALWIPADWPPGEYQLAVRLVDKAPHGPWVDLGSVVAE